MAETRNCHCQLDCDHHRGKPCGNEAIHFPSHRIVIFGEPAETAPVSIGFCEPCLKIFQTTST